MLRYVHNETALKKGKGSKSMLPFVEFIDVPTKKIDCKLTSSANDALKLALFFNSSDNSFQLAEAFGDGSVVHLQSTNVLKAFISYLACYFVFHLHYPREFSQSLGFMQQALTGVAFEETKYTGFCHLWERFEKEYERLQENSKFKKFCV